MRIPNGLLRDRLKMCLTRVGGVIQAWDVDPNERGRRLDLRSNRSVTRPI